MLNTTILGTLLLAFLALPEAARAQRPGTASVTPQTVLFVCEHGAAKSVIAAAHFNKIAKERGLPYRAVARGTAPDATIPPGVRQGVERSGLELPVQQPMMVAKADVSAAQRVITFEIGIPEPVLASTVPADWRAVPSVSADFDIASADIKRRVEALIDELMRK